MSFRSIAILFALGISLFLFLHATRANADCRPGDNPVAERLRGFSFLL